MCGLLILKQLYNLSDESVVSQWKQNPYYQVFCGETSFQNTLLCHSTELVKFRQRLGKAGIEKLLSLSVALHGDASEETTVLVDTTVQEKAITYPTDSKLAIKSINRLNKLAKSEGVKQRRTFVKEVKALRLACRHFRHVKRPQDKNKIYSLHESDIYCVGKGKDHKMYEYGRKASVVSTVDSQVIVGVESHDEHIHDSKTLSSALASANGNRKTAIELAVVIEPLIGHLKHDFRLQRNWLNGSEGDAINLLMAACAWNLRKWMVAFFLFEKNGVLWLFCAIVSTKDGSTAAWVPIR